jgi:hypothetical protein
MAIGMVRTYMEKWLHIATLGNCVVKFAFATDRMVIHCNQCDVNMTISTPQKNNEIDFSIQEFAKLHRHDGTYEMLQEKYENAKIKAELLEQAINAQEAKEAVDKLVKKHFPAAITMDKTGRKFR